MKRRLYGAFKGLLGSVLMIALTVFVVVFLLGVYMLELVEKGHRK